MANIKVKFRPSIIIGHEGTIYYQVIHERQACQFISKHHILPDEWDDKRSTITVNTTSARKSYVFSVRERVQWDVELLTKIVHRFETDNMVYTAKDIIDEFYRYTNEYSMLNFMENIITKLRCNGKTRTSETYLSTMRSFGKFLLSRTNMTWVRPDGDIMLENITSETMEAYEAWLRRRGVSPNTTSFYIRILRAVYNRAVEQEITKNKYPFKHVYTGIGKTIKRALPLRIIKTIKAMNLSDAPKLEFARDMFLMSFFLRGMSFIDMAYLRKDNLDNGRLTYRRRKTGQLLVIRWTDEMQHLLNKYPPNESPYLLPIIPDNVPDDEYHAYRKVCYNINHNLKKIGRMIGIETQLTLYVARHSWASAAKNKGIPLHVISEGMGHDSETTTRIYLASLDTSVVDNANSIILSSL